MRAVIQRVNRAAVWVDGEVAGEITRPGLMALVGATHDDGPIQVATVARKIVNLWLLEGEFPVTDAGAPVLVVSQFTLYADTRRSRRPTWNKAALGEVAEPLVGAVAEDLRGRGPEVVTGHFGADMKIDVKVDGPVTILIEAEQADEAEDATEGDTEMTGCSRAVMAAMMLWWAVFGCIGVSWALGSPWLVDTVLQGDGLRFAQERPIWFAVVVLVSGPVRLGLVVFGFTLLRLDVIKASYWMRLAFGWVSGVPFMAYGMAGSALAVPTITSGEPLSRYGWWRLVLWTPHFRMGGTLVLATTVVYFHWSRFSSVEPRRV